MLSVPQLAFFSLARTLLLFFFFATANLSCQVCFSLPSSLLPLSWPLPALRLLLNLPVTSAVNCRQFCRTLRPHGKWQSKQQGLGAVVWFFLAQPSLAPLKLTGLPWLHGSLTLPHSQTPFNSSHGSHSLLPQGLSTCSSVCLNVLPLFLTTSYASFRLQLVHHFLGDVSSDGPMRRMLTPRAPWPALGTIVIIYPFVWLFS